MAKELSEREEDEAFIRRVRQAREAKFDGQKPVYSFLEVPQDHYKHWETQRPMPRRYIPKFCLITEVSMDWLLTGVGRPPVVRERPKAEKPAKAKSKASAA